MFQDKLINQKEKELALTTPILLNHPVQSNLLYTGSFSSYIKNELSKNLRQIIF